MPAYGDASDPEIDAAPGEDPAPAPAQVQGRLVLYEAPKRPGGSGADFEEARRACKNRWGFAIFPGTTAWDLVLDVLKDSLHSQDSHASTARELRLWIKRAPNGSRLPGADLRSDAGVFEALTRVIVPCPSEPCSVCEDTHTSAIHIVYGCPLCGAGFCGDSLLARLCPSCNLDTHYDYTGAPQHPLFVQGDFPQLFRFLVLREGKELMAIRQPRSDGIIAGWKDGDDYTPVRLSANEAGQVVCELSLAFSIDGVLTRGDRVLHTVTPFLTEFLDLPFKIRRLIPNMLPNSVSIGPRAPMDIHKGQLLQYVREIRRIQEVGVEAWVPHLQQIVLFTFAVIFTIHDGLGLAECMNHVGVMAEAGSPLDEARSEARSSGRGRTYGTGQYNPLRYLVPEHPWRSDYAARLSDVPGREVRSRPAALRAEQRYAFGAAIQRAERAGDSARARLLKHTHGVIGPSAWQQLRQPVGQLCHAVDVMHNLGNIDVAVLAVLVALYLDKLPAIARAASAFRLPGEAARTGIDILAQLCTHKRCKTADRQFRQTSGALKAATLGIVSRTHFDIFKRVCSAMRRLISSAYHRSALPALENDLAELWVLWLCNTPEASWSIQWLYLQYLVGQMRKIPNGEVSAWATERWYGHMVAGGEKEGTLFRRCAPSRAISSAPPAPAGAAPCPPARPAAG